MPVPCLRAGLFVYSIYLLCYGNVLLRIVFASIVLPVIVLWFFMRCSGGHVLFAIVVDRAFEPVGDRSMFDHFGRGIVPRWP